MNQTFKFRKKIGDHEMYIVLAVDETEAWVKLARKNIGINLLTGQDAKEVLSKRFRIVPANEVHEKLYTDPKARSIARRTGLEV